MKLTFLHTPVRDLPVALAFYRDTLGWEEAWREGADTVAFRTPGSDVQVMLVAADDDRGAGPMYLVPSLTAFLAEHPDVQVAGEVQEIPDGAVVELRDPAGNAFYVFDQAGA